MPKLHNLVRPNSEMLFVTLIVRIQNLTTYIPVMNMLLQQRKPKWKLVILKKLMDNMLKCLLYLNYITPHYSQPLRLIQELAELSIKKVYGITVLPEIMLL